MDWRAFLAASLCALGALPAAAQEAAPQEQVAPAPYAGPVVYVAQVKATYPHDPEAFTQGLLWHDGHLYESTGREGLSQVRKVALETGEVLAASDIPADQFGEGLALWEDEFVSLTWRDGAVHRWDAETLAAVSTNTDFGREAWGLTSLPEGLVMSDGSSTLRVLDPATYEIEREIEVTMNGRPVRQLNELEVVDGLILANVWHQPFILAIDPESGEVRKLIDLRAIVASVTKAESEAVLNGIAWDADNRRLFVTGKLWPDLFEIELVETGMQLQ